MRRTIYITLILSACCTACYVLGRVDQREADLKATTTTIHRR